jgi:hypothetical protein
MKMKKAALATKYKFNINRSVGMSTTIRFSLGVTKEAVDRAFKNARLDPLAVAQATIRALNIKLIESETENASLKTKVEFLLKTNAGYKKRMQSERKQIAEDVVSYWFDRMKKEKEKSREKDKPVIFLSVDGLIYREPKDEHKHRIDINSKRGKFLLVIMESKAYTPTREIIAITGLASRKSVESAAYEMRKDIEKKLGVADFIDGYQDYGYRINPGVIFKKE